MNSLPFSPRSPPPQSGSPAVSSAENLKAVAPGSMGGRKLGCGTPKKIILNVQRGKDPWRSCLHCWARRNSPPKRRVNNAERGYAGAEDAYGEFETRVVTYVAHLKVNHRDLENCTMGFWISFLRDGVVMLGLVSKQASSSATRG